MKNVIKPRVVLDLTGYIAVGPEVIRTKTGKDMVKFKIAMNEGPKGPDQKTTWYDCLTTQPELATQIFNSFKKGMLVTVVGPLTPSIWRSQNGAANLNMSVFVNKYMVHDQASKAPDGEFDL